jgi:glycine cleavage system aminomethyltransferase T
MTAAGPIKRSSVHHLHADGRTKFVVQHGWEIAASFGDLDGERKAAATGTALADVSWLGKLECKGAWVGGLGALRLPDAVACPITPARLIWIVKPEQLDRTREALEQTRAGHSKSYLIDVSSVYASFNLVGPGTADVMAKLTSSWPEIGLPIFSGVAGVRCLLIRSNGGLRMHFNREFGEHLWKTLLDAGREFNMRAVGVEALPDATTA